MKYLLKFDFGIPHESILTYSNREERDRVLHQIYKADWNKVFLIQDFIKKQSTLVDLSKVYAVYCIDEEELTPESVIKSMIKEYTEEK